MRTKPSAEEEQQRRLQSKMKTFAQNRLSNIEMIRQNPYQEQARLNQELIKSKQELEKTCYQMDIEDEIELENVIRNELLLRNKHNSSLAFFSL
jgi:hypothetical protein